MAPEGTAKPSGSIVDDIVDIRPRWHTKNHPMFSDLAKGELNPPYSSNP